MFFDDSELGSWRETSKKLTKRRDNVPKQLLRLSYARPVRPVVTLDEFLSYPAGSAVMYDVEVYRNYFLVAFKHIDTGTYWYIEISPDSPAFDKQALLNVMYRYCVVGFNSIDYDLPIITYALDAPYTHAIKKLSNQIIFEDKRIDTGGLPINHIDLIEVAPLQGSLKLYAARLHCKRMQELPIDPEADLSRDDADSIRDYCFNDLDNTELLYRELLPHIRLREKLGAQFGMDLRSRSDAQLAQEIINREITRITGKAPKRPGPKSAVGKTFRYVAPSYIRFVSPELNRALDEIQAAEIVVGPTGHVICPKSIEGRKIIIAGKAYTIGMGGLHSKEKSQAVIADENTRVIDRDVTGYYPNLILKNGFAPPHLGEVFLSALQAIVDRRTAGKAEVARLQDIIDKGISNDIEQTKAMLEEAKPEADGLKIASNGTFGKTSDPYSTIYAPEQMVQITVTGQLCLLMAIERLEIEGIPVVSANTDGIVMACPRDKYDALCNIFRMWEARTMLETEETEYKALYSANVNNYIAVKMDGKCKPKGWYSEKGSALNSPLSKNPQCLVVSDALQAFFTKNKPIEETIAECTDVRKFVAVMNVKGGAHKDGYYLGKVVRWYYGEGQTGEINYISNGNKVQRSEAATPLMQMDGVPADLDRARYIADAYEELYEIGYYRREPKKPTTPDLFSVAG